MQPNDDLKSLFNMGDEEPATLLASEPGSSSLSIKVKFYGRYESAHLNKGEVTAEQDEAHCLESDLGSFTHGTLTVRGLTKRVKEIRKDGSGVAVLVLSDDN